MWLCVVVGVRVGVVVCVHVCVRACACEVVRFVRLEWAFRRSAFSASQAGEVVARGPMRNQKRGTIFESAPIGIPKRRSSIIRPYIYYGRKVLIVRDDPPVLYAI